MDYLKRICKNMKDDWTEDQVLSYIVGSNNVGGRPRKLDSISINMLVELATSLKSTRLRILTSIYNEASGGEDPLSTSGVFRYLKLNKITNKRLTRISMLRDEDAIAEYLFLMAPLDPSNFISVDETSSCHGTKLQCSSGRAPSGEDAVIWEFSIKNIQFSVIAAYTPLGFIAWRIYDGTVAHDSFERFLLDDLSPIITDSDIVILDNASVHKTSTTLGVLHDVTNGGNYAFTPPYENRLAPIEHGFANMWEEVRKHEHEAMISPMKVVHDAFTKYSIIGSHGHVAKSHFNPYFRNHEEYVSQSSHRIDSNIHNWANIQNK
jgi:transposase